MHNINSNKDNSGLSSLRAFFSPRAIFSIALFMTAGPCLIMVNKNIITELEFKFPVLVTSLGIISSSIIIHTGHYFDLIAIREEIKQMVTLKFLVKRILAISMLQALTMYFGNRAYIYLSVSLIQMLKAFTPVITMCMLFATQQATATTPLIISIFVLCTGTAVTTNGVTNSDYSLFGFLLAAGAQFSEALKLTLNQKLLQGFTVKTRVLVTVGDDATNEYVSLMNYIANGDTDHADQQQQWKVIETRVKMTTFEALYYYAPTTICCLAVIFVPLELSRFMNDFDRNIAVMSSSVIFFVVAALLGFAVNVAGFMVTKVISGLYLKALNTFRNVFVVLLSMYLFGDTITGQQAFGYFITLVGFSYYNYIKVVSKKP